MAFPSSLISFLILLLVSISFLILFLRRRRRIVAAKPDLKQRSQLQQLEQRHKELEEESAAAWLSPSVDPPKEEEEPPAGGGGGEEKRRKKKAKKKRQEAEAIWGGFPCPCPERDREAAGKGRGGGGGDCCFPFSALSATQRRIKVQYDELVKCNQAKQLTMAQVGQFVNCLVEARNELQHKSEIIQRSFKIKKALLVKADRSSFDRLCQQIYKLETEHKRLEEDAAVYNLLQEQLKLSPAYKTMLEAGANMEVKENQDQAVDVDFCDISFEELLAQEKKDSFWQRDGKLRSFPS